MRVLSVFCASNAVLSAGPFPYCVSLKFITTLKSEVYRPILQIRKLRQREVHSSTHLTYFSSICYTQALL